MKKAFLKEVSGDLRESIKSLVDSLGGFEKIINPGDTVLIKPNYNTADESPASTAPDFLEAVVDLVKDAGAGKTIVGESSTFTIKNHSISTKKTLCKACVYDLEKTKNPPEIYIFDDHEWVEKKIDNSKYLKKVSVPKIMDEVDKIIILPCCKTHFIADFTGALKIIIGFMKPQERIRFHMGRVSEKVAEMNLIYKPDLVIMDARRCFIKGGPSKGETREPNKIIVSESRIATDLEEIRIIQSYEGNSLEDKIPEELTQIKLAKELGIE